MPYKYRDLKWSDMTDRQKELAGSKEEHKAAKANYEAKQEAKSPSPEPSYSSSMMASSRNEPVTGPTFEPASSNEQPSRSTAVDKSKTWADLSKDERAATSMTKKEYNRQGYGSRIGQDPGTMNTMDFVDSDGDGIDDRNQKRPGGKAIIDPTPEMPIDVGTQGVSDFSELSKDSREALTSTGVTKKEYNRRVGDGSVSKFDIKSSVKGGADLAELTRLQNSGTVTDSAAQKYLNKQIKKLSNAATTDPQPEPILETPFDPAPNPTPESESETGGGTNTGGGNNTIGGGNNTIGGGNNTIGGGNNTIGGGNNTIGGGNNITGDGNNTVNETINQIQDVDIDQQNEQDFYVDQDNDLNVAISGDGNISDISQDNSVVNTGGDQSNAANITGPNANTRASQFLTNYLNNLPGSDALNGAGINLSDFVVQGPRGASSGSYDLDDRGRLVPTNLGNSFNTVTDQIQQVTADQGNDQNFNVTQDNDLNAQITGDNNVSQINQDNSIRNYGGDQRNFTYVSGPNANGIPNYLTDSPVSAATMAEFYAPSDSPASNAAFVDRYQTMNADAQKNYNPFGTAEMMIARGKNVGNVDMTALRQEINMAPELSRARSGNAFLNLFGDRDNAPQMIWNPVLGKFEPVDEFDPEEIYNNVENIFK